MSTVRMCDFMTPDGPCGTIFSEKEKNWGSGTITVIDDEGKPQTEYADFCPEHAPSANPRNRDYPRLNIRAALTDGSDPTTGN